VNLSAATPPTVTVYVSDWCPYCMRAKDLLAKKNWLFSEINVEDEPSSRGNDCTQQSTNRFRRFSSATSMSAAATIF